jgi:hypothetical protein
VVLKHTKNNTTTQVADNNIKHPIAISMKLQSFARHDGCSIFGFTTSTSVATEIEMEFSVVSAIVVI